MKTAIIIPARMASQRFPNKPMAKINGIPMIERVWRQGINSKAGDVYVACSEDEVFNLIVSNGGKAIMTDPDLPSGTDRVFAAFNFCLLYTSDAADEGLGVDLGGRRIIKKTSSW